MKHDYFLHSTKNSLSQPSKCCLPLLEFGITYVAVGLHLTALSPLPFVLFYIVSLRFRSRVSLLNYCTGDIARAEKIHAMSRFRGKDGATSPGSRFVRPGTSSELTTGRSLIVALLAVKGT